MDEHYCHAYPIFIPTNYIPENRNSSPNFNVEFEYTNMYVLNARKFHTYCDTTCHNFWNISNDSIMQESTIVSWLLDMGVPNDAFMLVVANVLECARDMNKFRKDNQSVLTMRVDLVVTCATEDQSDEEDEDEDEDVEESDNIEEDYEAVGDDDEEEEDNGLVAADKSSIKGLEIVRVEEEGCVEKKCSICFEDFNVGVRMPCFHMFHTNCIHSWLQIGSCCPLCRFQLPTSNKRE